MRCMANARCMARVLASPFPSRVMATPWTIGVCSWSLQVRSIPELERLLGQVGISTTHLALGDPHHASWVEDDKTFIKSVEKASFTVSAAMLAFPGEDYTTPQTIQKTGGFGDPATRKERMEMFKRAVDMTVDLGLKILGIRVEVSGREAIDKESRFVFMANHLSFIDGPMLYRFVPQHVRIILKKSIFRIPVLGQGMRYVGFVPVDRKGIRGGRQSIDAAARLMRERGYSYLIFPEGTRSRDGRTRAFRRGGFFLAIEAGAPIVPISIAGTFELMPKGSMFARSGPVCVRFHPPIPSQGYGPANMGELMDAVKAGVNNYVVKPFTAEVLQEKIETIFRKQASA